VSCICEGFVHDISQDGISIIINKSINYEFVELRIFDVYDIQLEINGRVIYCKESMSGKFLTGVKLLGSSDENKAYQEGILQCYKNAKKNLKIIVVGFLSQ
jgi:uncharacterized LabA/DUF88 family protein